INNYYNVTKRFDYALSKTMTDFLANNNDPRAKNNVYGTSSVGFPSGLSRNNAVDFANNHVGFAQVMNGQSAGGTDPFPVIMAGEIYLARAEAAQIGWTGEDPAAMYKLGIRSSWKFWKVFTADTAVDNYINRPAMNLAAGNALQKIATQEWVSHFPAGLRG